ncbi:MAG TPA: hypothetical protein VHO27_09640 [Angustibacter sp.]|nr:hypothetical protein [Angustibacter sp.]
MSTTHEKGFDRALDATDDDRDSTVLGVRGPGEARTSSHWRTGSIIALWLVVIAGVTGVLGVRSHTVRANGGGYSAQLTYASVARPGWDVPWHLVVRHPGGFGDGTVTVAVSRSMFDIYETQGFHPEPDSSTADDEYVYLEFAPPPGDTLVVDFDAYIQPTSQIGRRATVKVVTGGQERLRLHLHTMLLP